MRCADAHETWFPFSNKNAYGFISTYPLMYNIINFTSFIEPNFSIEKNLNPKFLLVK